MPSIRRVRIKANFFSSVHGRSGGPFNRSLFFISVLDQWGRDMIKDEGCGYGKKLIINIAVIFSSGLARSRRKRHQKSPASSAAWSHLNAMQYYASCTYLDGGLMGEGFKVPGLKSLTALRKEERKFLNQIYKVCQHYKQSKTTLFHHL